VEFEFDGGGREFELETVGGLIYGEVDGLFLLFGGEQSGMWMPEN
jgi:hypothetical protein